MLNQLFIVFNSRLQVAHSQGFILAVRNEDRARSV